MRKSRATLKARSRAAARVEAAKREERQREIELKTEAQRQEADRLAIEAQEVAGRSTGWGPPRSRTPPQTAPASGCRLSRPASPQSFVPGQGMVPYSGGIASPYPASIPGFLITHQSRRSALTHGGEMDGLSRPGHRPQREVARPGRVAHVDETSESRSGPAFIRRARHRARQSWTSCHGAACEVSLFDTADDEGSGT